MIDRRARARVVLAEAAALGIGLDDLVAAAEPATPRVPTVAAFIDVIAPQRTAGEAALPQRGPYNAVLPVRDRDCGPSPLVRRQFVGYRELRELQLSV